MVEKALIDDKEIVPYLLNKEFNMSLLKTVPYRDFADLALVVGNNYNEIVTYEELKHDGLSENYLFDTALKHLTENPDFNLINVAKILKQSGLGATKDDKEEFLITRNYDTAASNIMLCPKILAEYAARLDTDILYLIPISRHEMLCTASRRRLNIHFEKVFSNNRSVLLPSMVLSDHLYQYKDGKVSILEEV